MFPNRLNLCRQVVCDLDCMVSIGSDICVEETEKNEKYSVDVLGSDRSLAQKYRLNSIFTCYFFDDVGLDCESN